MLTETRIRAAKPSDRQYRLADAGGLYMQVETSGGRYWRFNYRLHGRKKTLQTVVENCGNTLDL